MINEASTCVEYLGSYWNEETINMVCQDGIYSTKRCPDQTMGGCRMNPDSETDHITWHYERGAGVVDIMKRVLNINMLLKPVAVFPEVFGQKKNSYYLC